MLDKSNVGRQHPRDGDQLGESDSSLRLLERYPPIAPLTSPPRSLLLLCRARNFPTHRGLAGRCS